jgi:cell division protein FtsL
MEKFNANIQSNVFAFTDAKSAGYVENPAEPIFTRRPSAIDFTENPTATPPRSPEAAVPAIDEPFVPPSQAAAPPQAEPKKESRFKLAKGKAQEKLESILNVKTFGIIIVLTLALVCYISNVIAINRLSREIQKSDAAYNEAKNLNITLESDLVHLQRIERISNVAYEKLGLKTQKESPILIKVK